MDEKLEKREEHESVKADVRKIYFLLHVECNLNRYMYAYTYLYVNNKYKCMYITHTHTMKIEDYLGPARRGEGGVRKGSLRVKYNGI